MADTDQYLENLLVKVAWYYYKENLTQNEISELLSLSRNKVVRLLEKARSEGIVQFHIKSKTVNLLDIETDLKNSFHLDDVCVVPETKGKIHISLAKAAAQYLETHMDDTDLLGLGWGETVSKTVEYLSIEPGSQISIVTLTGGANYYLSRHNSSVDKFDGRIHMIPAPFLASTDEMANYILDEPSVRDILSMVKLSKYVLMGIGGLNFDATFFREERMSTNELMEIKSKNAVGDILGQFFNEEGEILDLPHHARLIGLPITSLIDMKGVIAVAGGEGKVQAIYGALKGNYINTLITDESTAKTLLEMRDRK